MGIMRAAGPGMVPGSLLALSSHSHLAKGDYCSPRFYRRGTEAQGSCDLPTVTQLIERGSAALPTESLDSKALMHVASDWLGWFLLSAGARDTPSLGARSHKCGGSGCCVPLGRHTGGAWL